MVLGLMGWVDDSDGMVDSRQAFHGGSREGGSGTGVAVDNIAILDLSC